jgi:hypothetical protein
MLIQFTKIRASQSEEPNSPAVHRYRGSRPWTVAGMAIIASAGVLGLTGGLSALLSGFAAKQRDLLGEGLRDLTATEKRPAAESLPSAVVPSSAPPSTPTPKEAAAHWRIQIGTFRSKGAAVGHLRTTATRLPELTLYSLQTEPYGGNTRARISGIAGAERARQLCARVLEAGSGCYIVPPD